MFVDMVSMKADNIMFEALQTKDKVFSLLSQAISLTDFNLSCCLSIN